jgi:hypothetical protein
MVTLPIGVRGQCFRFVLVRPKDLDPSSHQFKEAAISCEHSLFATLPAHVIAKIASYLSPSTILDALIPVSPAIFPAALKAAIPCEDLLLTEDYETLR